MGRFHKLVMIFYSLLIIGGLGGAAYYYFVPRPEPKPEPDTYVYSPEILEQLAKYRPVYTEEIEEPSWMDSPELKYIYYQHDFNFPLYELDFDFRNVDKACFHEALRGNPRGMVCFAYNNRGVEYYVNDRAKLPKTSLKKDFWLDLAAKYMSKEWVELRLENIKSGSTMFGVSDLESNKGRRALSEAGVHSAMARYAASAARDAYKLGSRDYLESQQIQDYALRAAYACSEEGAQEISVLYRNGLGGFKDNFLSSALWQYIALRIESERTGVPPVVEPESAFQAQEKALFVRKHSSLILNQCREIKEEILQKQRPRWAELTRELHQILPPESEKIPAEPRKSWFSKGN